MLIGMLVGSVSEGPFHGVQWCVDREGGFGEPWDFSDEASKPFRIPLLWWGPGIGGVNWPTESLWGIPPFVQSVVGTWFTSSWMR